MGMESEILHQFRMLFPARIPNISPLRSTVLTKEARFFIIIISFYFLHPESLIRDIEQG